MPDTTVDRSARMDPSTPLTAREAAALDEADEQRARAEAAEERFHSAEDDISAARAAVRAGDWQALWRALGVEQERLPQMRTALDTAGELLELAPAGLTVEQEIRAEALHAAATISAPAGYDSGEVLDIAERFADYIRDGADEPDPVYCVRCGHACAHNPPHPLVDGSSGPVCQDEAWCEQERLRTGQICQPGQPYACGDYHHAGHCVRPTGDTDRGGAA